MSKTGNGAVTTFPRRFPWWMILYGPEVAEGGVVIPVDLVSAVHGFMGSKGSGKKCVFMYTAKKRAEVAVLPHVRPFTKFIRIQDPAEAIDTLTMLAAQGLTHVGFNIPAGKLDFNAYPIQGVIHDLGKL